MPTGINSPFSFTTRDYYDNNGDTNAAYGNELSWQQLDTTLLFLSGAIAGIPTSIAAVITGPSASIPTPPTTGEGTVYVVAGDPVPSKDGTSYIYDADTTTWYPFQLQTPLPYVRIYSASRQNITSSLLISGSEVTFSSSLYWKSGSGGATDANGGTAYTVVLSSSGQLYITGAYGGGGSSVSPLGFLTNANTTYQLSTGDVNKVVRLNNASTINVGVTASLFTSGSQIIVFQSGSGQISFSPSTGTNMYSANSMRKTRTQYSAATLIFSGSDCYLFGDIAP